MVENQRERLRNREGKSERKGENQRERMKNREGKSKRKGE